LRLNDLAKLPILWAVVPAISITPCHSTAFLIPKL
jgi:hypothetical protein